MAAMLQYTAKCTFMCHAIIVAPPVFFVISAAFVCVTLEETGLGRGFSSDIFRYKCCHQMTTELI